MDISSDEETAHAPVTTKTGVDFKIILEAVQAFQKSFGDNYTNPIKVDDGSSSIVGHVVLYSWIIIVVDFSIKMKPTKTDVFIYT